MSTFLLFYVTIYGAMQAYVGNILSRGLAWNGAARGLYALWALAMVALPVAARLLEARDAERAAAVAGFVAYTWMTWVLWCACFGLVADAWNVVVSGLGRFAPGAAAARIPARPLVLGLLGFAVIATAWGRWEAQSLRVRTIELGVDLWPRDVPPVRVALVSDIHAGGAVGPEFVARVVREIQSLQPDLLVATGDILDARTAAASRSLEAFRALQAPLGHFAVLGNHEFYVGAERAGASLRAAGFHVLRGGHVVVGDATRPLVVAGVDDPAGSRMGGTTHADENVALPREALGFTLLLKHQPDVLATSIPRMHLQLSGHTHGGQVFPFHVFVRLAHKRAPGLHVLAPGRWMYLSRGTGTWGPRLRFLAPPELTLFLLRGTGAGATPTAAAPAGPSP